MSSVQGGSHASSMATCMILVKLCITNCVTLASQTECVATWHIPGKNKRHIFHLHTLKEEFCKTTKRSCKLPNGVSFTGSSIFTEVRTNFLSIHIRRSFSIHYMSKNVLFICVTRTHCVLAIEKEAKFGLSSVNNGYIRAIFQSSEFAAAMDPSII